METLWIDGRVLSDELNPADALEIRDNLMSMLKDNELGTPVEGGVSLDPVGFDFTIETTRGIDVRSFISNLINGNGLESILQITVRDTSADVGDT